jgi:hypothetical protein
MERSNLDVVFLGPNLKLHNRTLTPHLRFVSVQVSFLPSSLDLRLENLDDLLKSRTFNHDSGLESTSTSVLPLSGIYNATYLLSKLYTILCTKGTHDGVVNRQEIEATVEKISHLQNISTQRLGVGVSPLYNSTSVICNLSVVFVLCPVIFMI